MIGTQKSKLTLFAGFLVLLALAAVATADTIEVRVSGGNDDAEEHTTEGNAIDLTSSDLELGEEGGTGDLQEIGVLFRNVNIPAGSTINSAAIQFTTDESDDESTSVRIFGELAANPSAYTATNGDITGRTKTVNSVDWNDIPVWQVEHEAGADQRTPDLSPVVQELINQPGWTVGNSMAFVLVPNPGGERTAESFDGEPNLAPLLTVDFTPIPEPSAALLIAIGLVGFVAPRSRRRA